MYKWEFAHSTLKKPYGRRYIMKIADIRKMNKEIVGKCDGKKFDFFKKLYEYCVSSLDAIPESFVKETLEEAYELGVIMYEVHFFQRSEKTYVIFGGETLNEEEFERQYPLDESTFDFKKVEVSFYFENEGTIRFYDTESIFDVGSIERIFGENLLGAEYDMYDVSVKCFE